MLNLKKIIIAIAGFFVLWIVAFLLYKFVINPQIQLKQEKNGNINILLLGIGGGSHEGPDLTDTIILLNVNPSKNDVNLVSIPRDLWIPDLKAKINYAYSYGQTKNNQGILLSKAVTEQVAGQTVDYVVVLDFSGFVKLVDYLGGIDVNVKRTLDDYAYPVEGKEKDTCNKTDQEIIDLSAQIATGSATEADSFPCRYEHILFPQGNTHMTGEQALKFVRSRHALGVEGTDFARSQRQQEVIGSIKTKVLSLGIILNPLKVIGIFNILKDNINTDIKVSEFDDFINLARKMQKATIHSTVLDMGDEENNRYGLLINPPPSKDQEYQWVLIPRAGNGNFSEVKDYLKCLETSPMCTVGKEEILKDKKIN